jgi:hypothetical protein
LATNGAEVALVMRDQYTFVNLSLKFRDLDF